LRFLSFQSTTTPFDYHIPFTAILSLFQYHNEVLYPLFCGLSHRPTLYRLRASVQARRSTMCVFLSTRHIIISLSLIFPAVGVLNFALTLEYAESEFYRQLLAKFSKEDFAKAGYPAWTRNRFEQVAAHEETHVEFLSSALSAAGAKTAKACEYDL
jgi:Ferritin-like domain